MTEVLKVLGYGAAGWFLLSVIVATGCAVLRHFTRTPGEVDAELAADLKEFGVQQEAARGIAEVESFLKAGKK